MFLYQNIENVKNVSKWPKNLVQSLHDFFCKDVQVFSTSLKHLNPHTVVRKLPLNPVVRGPHGPRVLFGVKCYFIPWNRGYCDTTSAKWLVFHFSKVTVFVTAGSARTPHNWIRVNKNSTQNIIFILPITHLLLLPEFDLSRVLNNWPKRAILLIILIHSELFIPE